MLDLIIKNGWVVNATHSQQMDIAVKDGKIVAMGQASLFPEAEKTVDAAGLGAAGDDRYPCAYEQALWG